MTEAAKAPFPPLMTGAETPKAAPAATTDAAPAPVKAPKEKKAKAPKAEGEAAKERKTPAKAMNPDQIKQVIAMVKDHSYTEIGEALNITKHQVNRVLMEVKNILKKNAAGDADKMAKVELYIKDYLSRPEDSKPGASGPKGGKVKNALNDIVGNILAGL